MILILQSFVKLEFCPKFQLLWMTAVVLRNDWVCLYSFSNSSVKLWKKLSGTLFCIQWFPNWRRILIWSLNKRWGLGFTIAPRSVQALLLSQDCVMTHTQKNVVLFLKKGYCFIGCGDVDQRSWRVSVSTREVCNSWPGLCPWETDDPIYRPVPSAHLFSM